MKNLKPLIRTKYYYDKIVDAKINSAAKTRLIAISSTIDKQYKEYSFRAKTDQLQRYVTSQHIKSDGDILKDCYGDTSQVIQLKEKILANQPVLIRYVCNYCMIGDSFSFDHYLSQSDFPEFSVLSINLVPVCDRCNKKKSDRFKDPATNERLFINLYFDLIPAQQFLFCQVKNKKGTFVPTFSLGNPNGIAVAKFRLIEQHFKALEILDRIHLLSNSQVVGLGQSISHHIGSWTQAEAANSIIRQAATEKQNFGNNYCWALLKEQLAQHPGYMASIGFP